MAPNKFEKELRAKFRKREIEPSINSWNQLNSQLEETNKTKRKGFFWYGIAASFIGLMIVSVLFFNKDNDLIKVDVQTVTVPEQKEKVAKKLEPMVIEEIVEHTDTIRDKFETKEHNLIEEDEAIVYEEIPVFETEANDVKLPDAIVNEKITEVIAQVKLLEEHTDALTDAEVDSLLRNAQKEILTEQYIATKGVDAMALLTEVEDELDQSFRDKIFKSLKTKFLKSRSAVADRKN